MFYLLDPLQERMIQKGFQITKIESVMQNVFAAAAAASTGRFNKDIFTIVIYKNISMTREFL